MKKIFLSLLLIACWAVTAIAMPAAVQRNLPMALELFNHEKPFQMHAYWYCFNDVDGDTDAEKLEALAEKFEEKAADAK